MIEMDLVCVGVNSFTTLSVSTIDWSVNAYQTCSSASKCMQNTVSNAVIILFLHKFVSVLVFVCLC